jgi:excinuclease ABC subunit C
MKIELISRDKISQLPKNSGIYVFKKNGGFLYIGKAINIQRRVKNHFQQPGDKDFLFLDKVKKIGYIETNSEIEALILEANLIKKCQPKYNVIWKDDKNYFFVGITKEDFPRVFITHQLNNKQLSTNKQLKIKKLSVVSCQLSVRYVGPFVNGEALKQTLKILRKIFPYRSCKNLPKPRTRAKLGAGPVQNRNEASGSGRPCLWYHLERCPAPCLMKTKLEEKILFNQIKRECQKNAENVFKIFQGKKTQILKSLKKEMKEVSRLQDFERAAKMRNQIEALEKILTNAKIFEPQLPQTDWQRIQEILKGILKSKREISRIEAYDVSNIQGQLATGAMVTFIKGKPEKNYYRKFKIKFSGKPNDIAMIKEILSRRVNHPEWPYPDLILIDGGKAQLNVALKSLTLNFRPGAIAVAKKRNELYLKDREPILLRNLPREIFNLILQLRDEAHRFAISYHKKLREKALFDTGLTFN